MKNYFFLRVMPQNFLCKTLICFDSSCSFAVLPRLKYSYISLIWASNQQLLLLPHLLSNRYMF